MSIRSRLTEFDTSFVIVAARTLADPTDPKDLAVVHGIQDGLSPSASGKGPRPTGQYDEDSYEATKKPLLELTDGIGDTRGMFGTLDVVEPERFVVG